MKHLLTFVLIVSSFLYTIAQPVIREKKYPSLLWEITGNGTTKPSYLIGTMHVSSKLAFHLPDSFYIAVRNAKVVALETNPETWQEDMNKYEMGGEGYGGPRYGESFLTLPSDYLTINTLKFFKYENKIEQSLYSNPSTINNLLYRSYGERSSDFEEDTYLDMYIYQCGKKRGKSIAGVEDYGESMRLMAEAYRDAAKDKNRKQRSYGDVLEGYTPDKLQEAYRTGNLDLLDSINKFNSVSAAFDEKFLYRRNEIQAESIDSIIKSGSPLFVGVGAAHLPGNRGVIEMLRQKGYKLRPIKMGERSSREKDITDKIRVPVNFKTTTADDGMYKVDIPGTFYKTSEDVALDQRQYADMANGSYYMVTRIMTNAWLWNHDESKVYKTIDSLLYENIPGKIISKTAIIRNGYKGVDITNRTRRGDVQRYNIFITPFEILFFKMSGNSDYVREGTEAEKFFSSIQLNEYYNSTGKNGWIKYTPPYGGFTVELPHQPYIGNDGSWIYDAVDKKTGTQYRILRTDIHNYSFAEEDSFDLGLMDESFMASEFIATQLSRKQTQHKGYPALDASYRDKDGQLYITRFIIQGPHYYTLVAHGPKEVPAMNNFINSFAIAPYVYPAASVKKDTALYYTVTTPVFPESKKIKLDMPTTNYFDTDEEEGYDEETLLGGGTYKSKTITNDTTGEKLHISFYQFSKYQYIKDSTLLDDDKNNRYADDSTMIVRWKKKNILPGGMRTWEVMVSDTGSSRTLWFKSFYKNGSGFMLSSQSDTMTKASPFLQSFYETFLPADTVKGSDPFVKKSTLFFNDLASTDTAVRKKAIKYISQIELDSADFPALKNAISSIIWKEKKYLDVKGGLMARMGGIKTKAAADYLRDAYYAVGDTVQLQYIALENLLQQQTNYAYSLFKDIINTEPPVLGLNSKGYGDYDNVDYSGLQIDGYDNGSFFDELYDSLPLTKTVLPDLLPLLNLEDYKESIMGLLGVMADSNLLAANDYEIYYSKFLIEAKQELRKQAIAEKKKAIDKAEESKKEKKEPLYPRYDEDRDEGNADLSLYTTLLLPFADKYPAVNSLMEQMLKSNDKELKYNTLLQLMDKGRAYPDSLLTYFASMDEYRYELYTDLRFRKKQQLFPARYNNHLDLARSSLLDSKAYGKPDSLVFLERLKTEYKKKTGFIYFFRYKDKKDDLSWKIATVGLVPENPALFEFEDSVLHREALHKTEVVRMSADTNYDFTEFTEEKLKDDMPVIEQLRKELKKMIYSRRKSAVKFYDQQEQGRYNNNLID